MEFVWKRDIRLGWKALPLYGREADRIHYCQLAGISFALHAQLVDQKSLSDGFPCHPKFVNTLQVTSVLIRMCVANFGSK